MRLFIAFALLTGATAFGQVERPLYLNCGIGQTGRVGQNFMQRFIAEGGTPPVRYNISGTVPGLGFDSYTGTLRGTPVSAGTFSLSVSATDRAGSNASATCSVRIENTALAEASCGALPLGQVGTAYEANLQVSGGIGPYSWQLKSGSLPGLTLHPDGTITGKPHSAGAFPFTATVRDSGSEFEQTRTVACQIRINSER
jgi:hypothetical protein